MKKNILNKIFFLLFAASFVFSGCASRKKLIKNSAVQKDNLKENVVLKNINASETSYQSFATKAKANIDLNGKSYDVTINLRIKKKEKIWASVTAIAGLEVARLLITPDSIKLINRLENTYFAKPFPFIYTYTNQHIDFNALEALFTGNNMPFTLKFGEIMLNSNILTLSGKVEDLSFENTYANNFKPLTLFFNNLAERQQLKVNYEAYTEVANRIVPQQLKIASNINAKSIHLNLVYQSPQLDVAQDYPFSVPKRYTVIE